jgi:YfiR/HmsC-like
VALVSRLLARCRRAAVAAFALALLLAATSALAAQGEMRASADGVRAAFLFKFGSYVEWPPDAVAANEVFTIGVVGADSLADELARVVAGRNVSGRPVAVRRLRADEALDGLAMVYIGEVERDELRALLAALQRRPTLAVTESEGALALGSMINFVLVDGKLRFDVALAPVRAGSLRISSRLLGVARSVKDAS